MTTERFVPPAAEGLPQGALDSATEGANALDAWALDPRGRNFLAHALVQLARDGWLRTAPAAVPVPPPADQTTLRERIAGAARTVRLRLGPNAIAAAQRGEPIILSGGEADDLADAVLPVLPEQTDRAAVLTDRERAMLSFALEMAQEEIYARSLEFTDEDRAALETLRRVAAEEQPTETQGVDAANDLPARLEAVLTGYTELGNPFSEMRRHEQGPDGWPASRPVGPHHVAEVLRELLAAPAVGEQPETQETP